MSFKAAVQSALRARGIEVRRTSEAAPVDVTVLPADKATSAAVRPFTMTSPDRILAACDAIRYVDRFKIPGAIVECGVWAGGSVMAMIRTLIDVGDMTRDVYLFDTFDGMTDPTAEDRDIYGRSAAEMMAETDKQTATIWAYRSLPDVRRNVGGTGYPSERTIFVQGKVEDTVPDKAPDQIAVLRLDTDWYESTKHELTHLVDRVAPGGVLIIDDYGHFQGARKAVDEWLATVDRPVLLNRIDYSGRLAVLP
jgi:O-methyltransferase